MILDIKNQTRPFCLIVCLRPPYFSVPRRLEEEHATIKKEYLNLKASKITSDYTQQDGEHSLHQGKSGEREGDTTREGKGERRMRHDQRREMILCHIPNPSFLSLMPLPLSFYQASGTGIPTFLKARSNPSLPSSAPRPAACSKNFISKPS